MILGLDHVVLPVDDVEDAAARYGVFLGREPAWEGQLDDGAASVFSLSNMALCLRARREGDPGELIVLKVGDLDAAVRLAGRRGLPALGEETTFGDRRLVRLDPAAAGGLNLALVSSDGPGLSAPAVSEASAVGALDHVVIAARSGDRALALWGARLGLDLRLDRSNPAWGARQMFFACGGLVMEVVLRLGEAETPDRPDRFSGLAWRAGDAAAVQDRLQGLGFNVSEVRTGRKPGTRIFTLREGVAFTPTVVLQQNAGTAGAEP
ncbi:MAG: VOC family protein [Phenylobacterium sp.]|uniref:VOC family protein n=1 Tax=Phenylobacterium sp. TaxID=1871053 RepID=UPI0025E646F7|nr:VOC family protein [Phenylobacterium sp.]MCA3728728.1 VOC family protein [Phenylobacterium sp.]MCA3732696.1 VOC family protein [Phenylobacterium sp.]MCA6271808.1 VOC family protein [Phenylobacterium sp.]MCA6279055.1 VOC family protein [Phenylobacterium sp.]MCA6295310.1 VOC family protein [Phenylobacterium sp.]